MSGSCRRKHWRQRSRLSPFCGAASGAEGCYDQGASGPAATRAETKALVKPAAPSMAPKTVAPKAAQKPKAAKPLLENQKAKEKL